MEALQGNGLFLHASPESTETVRLVPTKAFLHTEPRHSHAVFTLQVHPPTYPCPSLPAYAEPKTLHNEAESITASYEVIGQERVNLSSALY